MIQREQNPIQNPTQSKTQPKLQQPIAPSHGVLYSRKLSAVNTLRPNKLRIKKQEEKKELDSFLPKVSKVLFHSTAAFIPLWLYTTMQPQN